MTAQLAESSRTKRGAHDHSLAAHPQLVLPVFAAGPMLPFSVTDIPPDMER